MGGGSPSGGGGWREGARDGAGGRPVGWRGSIGVDDARREGELDGNATTAGEGAGAGTFFSSRGLASASKNSEAFGISVTPSRVSHCGFEFARLIGQVP